MLTLAPICEAYYNASRVQGKRATAAESGGVKYDVAGIFFFPSHHGVFFFLFSHLARHNFSSSGASETSL
jgi:hypothetical protein